ncbi:MAG: 50S ribosomal protein L11 methyltransferase [Vicinamibacterales bacterium]
MRVQLENHRVLLQDRNRIAAYERAIDCVIRPGDHVIDLGAGSGILGWMALRAGAGHVWAVDDSPVSHLLRHAADANGMSDRVTVVPQHSASVQLPARADVVLCDQAGPMGWEGGLLDLLHDARHRLLKPGGRLMPSTLETWVAPAHRPDVHAAITSWQQPVAGFDFSFVSTWAAEDLWVVDAGGPGGLVASGQRAARWTLGAATAKDASTIELDWILAEPCAVSGFEAWFRCELAPAVSITNGPEESAITRPRRFLPLRTPLLTRADDVLSLRLYLNPAGRLAQWSGSLIREGHVIERFSVNNLASLVRSARLPAGGPDPALR